MKRDFYTMPLGLGNELIIDNFAGGGGTSEGLEQAFGRPVDIAINHDPEALAMHALNHPYTKHLCESVWDVDPIKVTGNQPVGLVWLSPDCKHFSKAKGGTPVSKDIRGLAWVTVRWAMLCKPRSFMLENVEEFKTWGPLMVGSDGKLRPDPERAGETFEAFCGILSTGIRPDHPALQEACEFLEIDFNGVLAQLLVRGLGYDIGHKELRACDNNAPTIRKRIFYVGRRDGLPIVWPKPSNGAPVSREVLTGMLAPFRTAAECIDFDLPSQSIFDRKKQLVVNTLRRVTKGMWRHVLTSASPFIVGAGGPVYSGKPVSTNQPFGTLTTENHRALVAPTFAPFINEHANSSSQRTMPADEPLRTVCAQVKGGHFSVVAPMLVPLRGTSEAHLGGHSVEQPLSTVSAGGTHHAMISAHIIKYRKDSAGSSMDAPMPTVTASSFVKRPGGSAPLGMVSAHLMHLTHHGDRPGTTPADPLPTITCAHRGEQALTSAFFEQANGGFYDGDGRSADDPISTITASGSNQRLVTAYLIKYYGSGGQWQGCEEPMHTLPTKGRMGLVEIVNVPVDCLSPEHRAKARKCAELMHEHLPEHFPNPADMVLMHHNGAWWVLVDITLRMLKPRELYRAQSFPNDYIIHEIPDPKFLFIDGVQVPGDPRLLPRIPLSVTAQIRMCGNSVAPAQARALVEANFAHEREIARVA